MTLSASGLIRKIRIDPVEYPLVSWRWKVMNVLEKGDVTKKEGDDYAARIYVVFSSLFFWEAKTINYVWANKIPLGEAVTSPYTPNAVMIAVESGNDKAGRWISEKRNVLEDYRQCFGKEPPKARAIAMMTDTDNTGESTTAWYGPIRSGSSPILFRRPWRSRP